MLFAIDRTNMLNTTINDILALHFRIDIEFRILPKNNPKEDAMPM
jgi:hypothetical protein